MDELLRGNAEIGSSKSHRISTRPNVPSHASKSSNKFANDGITRYVNSQAASWTGRPKTQVLVPIADRPTVAKKSDGKKRSKAPNSDLSSSDDDLLLTDNSSIPGTPFVKVTSSYDRRSEKYKGLRFQKISSEVSVNAPKINDENRSPDVLEISSAEKSKRESKPTRRQMVSDTPAESRAASSSKPSQPKFKPKPKPAYTGACEMQDQPAGALPVTSLPSSSLSTRRDSTRKKIIKDDPISKLLAEKDQSDSEEEAPRERHAKKKTAKSDRPKSSNVASSSQTPPITKKTKGKAKEKDSSPAEKKNSQKKRKKADEKKPLEPAPFPMLDSPSFQRAQRKYENKMKGLSTDDDTESEARPSQGKQKSAFPMTSEDFIESWEKTNSSFSKRPSTETENDETSPKKLKGNGILQNPADLSISQMITIEADEHFDPKTLCPYCDAPLPPVPSPLLLRMIQSLRSASFRDPRPGNSLGLKAPIRKYIDICKRHNFESMLLPQAQEKGWPTRIDFSILSTRVEGLKYVVERIIANRDISEFWRDLQAQIEKDGTRKVTSISGQFSAFEKSQPGYYGEQGSVIIYQTLYTLFPFDTLDVAVISPLSQSEFMHRVLVPEVAVALIQEDLNLDRAQAIETLRDSSSYGVSMFPEMDKPDDTGSTVGDRMLKERARARRMEIEAEEAKEKEAAAESLRTKNSQETESDGVSMDLDDVPVKEKTRGKSKGSKTTRKDDGFVFDFQVHVSETSDSVVDLSSDEELERCSSRSLGEDTSKSLKTPKPKARPKPKPYSSAVVDFSADDNKDDDPTPKPKRTSATKSRQPNSSNLRPTSSSKDKNAPPSSSLKMNNSSQPLAFTTARSKKDKGKKKEGIWKYGLSEANDSSSESSHHSSPHTKAKKKTSGKSVSKKPKTSWLLSDDDS